LLPLDPAVVRPSAVVCDAGRKAIDMARQVHGTLLGLVVFGLAGCTGTVQGTGPGSGRGGNSGSAGTGAAAGGSSLGGSVGAGGGPGPGSGGVSGGGKITCVPGIPPTTQLRRMLNWQYEATLRDLLGVTSVGSGADAKPTSAVLYADSEGPIVPDAWRLYQDTAAAIAKQVMANATQKAKFISCDPAASGCLENTIRSFGRKAFRRPLTTDEVNQFLALGQGAPMGTPAEVAEATLYAFLVSPPFLLLPETSAPNAAGQLPLSGYEVATRLSYTLWGSVPDDPLNAAADANQLQTKEQILTQAKRMIAVRDRTSPLVSAFHRTWAQMNNSTAHWWSSDHDTSKFPAYSSGAKATYSAELDQFFAEVAFTNGTYKDLFTSNIGFVNKDNAAIYGLTNSGTTLTKVALDPVQRPGFMTRAGFLSSYSHYDETAPILRGAFITIYMIGVDPGPPIAGATMMKPPPGTYTSNREKTEALVNQAASCKACHSDVINPPGYVLENYDAIGRWQTMDPLSAPIDATATVNFGDGKVKPIANAQQLMQELAATPKGQQSYAQQWVAFGYGRASNSNDQCVADQISAKLAATDYTILNVLADLTQTDSFRLRVRATP